MFGVERKVKEFAERLRLKAQILAKDASDLRETTNNELNKLVVRPNEFPPTIQAIATKKETIAAVLEIIADTLEELT